MIEHEWYYISAFDQRANNVNDYDIKPEHSRYDRVRQGYWIQVPSSTATVLALKGCLFKKKIGQTNW